VEHTLKKGTPSPTVDLKQRKPTLELLKPSKLYNATESREDITTMLDVTPENRTWSHDS